MKSYTHLTEHERYHINMMNKQNYTLTEIARTMDRNKSTISREIKRNTGGKGYRHKQAHYFAKTRHGQKNKRIKLNDDLQHYIKQKLGLYWSPEQVSGRLRMEENMHISTETIYRMILKDKVAGGSLYRFLRHQGKKYRKRYGKNDYRGIIPNRVDIADRPSVVDSRSRIGDWEADCVIGKGHKGVFATLAERKSRFYLALPIKRKTAQETNAAILRLLEKIKQFVMTLTFDNGREFSWHSELAKQLECETYFAKPYHSWERGLNENHNGLLRQFFPKQMPLHQVTEKELFNATDLMNNRPRKCLGYKTPWEVFSHALGIDHNINPSVALMS